MNTDGVMSMLQGGAVWVVFGNVLLQQLGLPVPAVPTLLVAGSIAMSYGHMGQMLAAAVFASVLADWAWYLAGRAFGYKVLSGLCRLSINPGTCVSTAEALFMRWGAWSLIVAKFVPGFSTVAPPIAGSLQMPLSRFLVAAGIGAGLWAGAALVAGWVLRAKVQWAIDVLSRNGMVAVAAVALVLVSWLAWKLWQRRRFEQLAIMPHVTVAELRAALASDLPPLLLDLRGAAMVASAGPIHGALTVKLEDLPAAVGAWPKEHPIVTLCACPSDATARQAAQVLLRAGYGSTRPLRGGYDAWMEQSDETAA